MSEKSDIMYFVTLKEIVNRFKLEWINRPKNCSEIKISSNEVNRPGMQIAGL